jgi:membrane-associated protein
MEALVEFFGQFHSLEDVITWGGYIILFLIIYVELGFFFGFFLPGNSLVLTAGLIAASGQLDLLTMNAILILAALLGDATGYVVGHKLGRPLFKRSDSTFFHHDHLEKAQAFYDKYGAKAVVFGRFVPMVRSFITTVAGITTMNRLVFASYSLLGSVVWIGFYTTAGYVIGTSFPEYQELISRVILFWVIVLILSAVIKIVRSKPKTKNQSV